MKIRNEYPISNKEYPMMKYEKKQRTKRTKKMEKPKMKKRMMFIVLVLAIMCVILSCDKDSTGPSDIENNFEWCDVPAGDYTWGEDDEIQNIAYDYQIMKYEVTNQQYVDYLTEVYANGDIVVTALRVEGYYNGDENYESGNYKFYELDDWYNIITWNGSDFIIETSFEEHPVFGVTWIGAWAFAQHYGLRLPNEQEWEKAARGTTGYEYPWGNTISGDRANYRDSGDPWDDGTTPLGYYNGENGTTDSPSVYGVYDMCGNVYDWTDSWDSGTSSNRVLRGGGWTTDSSDDSLRSWYRVNVSPTYGHYGSIGFRCARTP